MSKILAIDFGLKRLGIAISDEQENHVFGRPTVMVKQWRDAVPIVLDLCQDEGVGEIVVGWPISLSGQENRISRDLKQFVDIISNKTSIAVKTFDERLTSRLAQRQLNDMPHRKKKGERDCLAAQIILQDYIDSKRK
ncbi:Holliday junction resolvase RuvX [Patescibacteria group bacterium]|nr:Holliday junction resolvase RuvX [Patescibacteria group bacterium]MBU1890353.1 Holliday junction resolvase RuvX [Patescibacteria group bacterium]